MAFDIDKFLEEEEAVETFDIDSFLTKDIEEESAEKKPEPSAAPDTTSKQPEDELRIPGIPPWAEGELDPEEEPEEGIRLEDRMLKTGGTREEPKPRKIKVGYSEYMSIIAESKTNPDIHPERYEVVGMPSTDKDAEKVQKFNKEEKEKNIAMGLKYMEAQKKRGEENKQTQTLAAFALKQMQRPLRGEAGMERGLISETIGEVTEVLKVKMGPIARRYWGQTEPEYYGSKIRESMSKIKESSLKRMGKEKLGGVSLRQYKNQEIARQRKAELYKRDFLAGEIGIDEMPIMDRKAWTELGPHDISYEEYRSIAEDIAPAERTQEQQNQMASLADRVRADYVTGVEDSTDTENIRNKMYSMFEKGEVEPKLSREEAQALANDQTFMEDMKQVGMMMMMQPDTFLKQVGGMLIEQAPLLILTNKGIGAILSAASKLKALQAANKLRYVKKLEKAGEVSAETVARMARQMETSAAVARTKKIVASPSLARMIGEEAAEDFGQMITAGYIYEKGSGGEYTWKNATQEMIMGLGFVGPGVLFRLSNAKVSARQFDQAHGKIKQIAGIENHPEVNRLIPMISKLSERRTLDGLQFDIKPGDSRMTWWTRDMLDESGNQHMQPGWKYEAGKHADGTATLYETAGPESVIEETAHFIQDHITEKVAAEADKPGPYSYLQDMIETWELSVRAEAKRKGISIPQGKETFAQAFTAYMGYADKMDPGVNRLVIPDEILTGMRMLMGDDPVLQGRSRPEYRPHRTLTGETKPTPPSKELPRPRDYDAEIRRVDEEQRMTRERRDKRKLARQRKDLQQQKRTAESSDMNTINRAVDDIAFGIMADPGKNGIYSMLETLKYEIDLPVKRPAAELANLKKNYQTLLREKNKLKKRKPYVRPAYQLKPEDKTIQASVEERFGTTDKFYQAGYINPAGDMINFSRASYPGPGKKAGGRAYYHEDVGEFMDVKGWKAVQRFMDMGNIRTNPALRDGVSINVKPTESQLATVRGYYHSIQPRGGEFTVQINPSKEVLYEGDAAAFNRAYDSQTPFSKIKQDITDHFEGKTPAPLSLAQQFHYQLKTIGKKERKRYVGAPEGWRGKSIGAQRTAIRRLTQNLEKFAEEGEVNRFWYEESSQAILDLTGGNLEEGKRLAQLIAITSPETTVLQNANDAMRFYHQYKAQKLKGIAPDDMKFEGGHYPNKMQQKAKDILLYGKHLGGRKVSTFSKNLTHFLDDAHAQGVTSDIWMARAFGFYDEKSGNGTKYDFIEKMVKKVARRRGWTPMQTQAAIWASIRDRWDQVRPQVMGKGLEGKWTEKKGNRLTITDYPKFYENMLKTSPRLKADLNFKKYTYENAFNDMQGRLSWEAVPGKTTKHLPGIHDLPYEARLEYTLAVEKAMMDEAGNNVILREIGLLEEGVPINIPGSWMGESSPALHYKIPMPRPTKPPVGKAAIDPTTLAMVRAAAAAFGYYTKQEGVGFHKPFYKAKVKDSNGIEFNINRSMTADEVVKFEDALNRRMGEHWAAIIPSDKGPRVINLMNEVGGKTLDNPTFHRYTIEAAEEVLPDSKAERFHTHSELIDNDWEVNPDGQSYRQRIEEFGGPNLLRRLDGLLIEKIRQVDDDFARRYGLGGNREAVAIGDQSRLPPGVDGAEGAIPATQYQLKSHVDEGPPGHAGPGGQQFDVTPESTWDAFRRKAQDRFLPVARIQKDIEAARGKIREEVDVYLHEVVYHGRAKAKIERLDEMLVQPLLTHMRANKVKLEDLGRYVSARHAPERNARIAEINPAMPDGGSGISTAEARMMMSDFRKRRMTDKLEAAARMVDRMHQERLRILREGGILNDETLQAYAGTYQKYMPMRGFEDMDATAPELPSEAGPGFGAWGKEKRALGRRSRAYNPVINSIAMLNDAVVRAEKNRVGQAFKKLVEENPNPALWEIDKINMRPQLDPNSGQVVLKKEFNLMPQPNEFPVKIDGEQHMITIHDPHLANAMKQMGTNNIGPVLKAFGAYNRFLSAINTSLYPVFVASNFVRDIQTAGFHLTAEQGAAMTLRVFKDVPMALRGALLGYYGKGKGNAWTKWYRRYEDAGGKVGWFGLKGVEDIQADVMRAVAGVDSKTGRVTRAFSKNVLQHIENVNGAVENGVRLAAFKNAVEAGMSEMQAARLAKELTVNFNRKGELGSAVNSLYLFYNASLQGMFRMGGALAKNKKLQMLAGAASFQSYILAEWNRARAGEDDSGKNLWDQLVQEQPWVTERNLVFMDGDGEGGYTKFPVPYGYNVFHVLGTSMSDIVHGGDPLRATKDLVTATFSAFNPLGSQSSKTGTGALVKTLTPSAAQPAVQFVLNENFAGIPIRPEQFSWGAPKPESELYFNGVRPISKKLAQKLNQATGGTIHRPGKIDISPETIDHFYETYTGGMGKFVGNTVNLIYSRFGGGEVADRDIPFWNRFRGSIFDGINTQRFYELDKELQQFDADERMIRQHGTELEKAKLKQAGAARRTKTRLKQMNQRLRRMEDKGAPAEAIEKARDKKRKVVDDFLKKYSEEVLENTDLLQERKAKK